MKILCIFGGHGGNSRWCRKTLKTQEIKHFIDWNDIFFGQKDLKNFKQNGTPYCPVTGQLYLTCRKNLKYLKYLKYLSWSNIKSYMWINQNHGCLFFTFTISELGPVGNVHWPAIAHKQIKSSKVSNNSWITFKLIVPICILNYINIWDVTFLAVSQAVLPDSGCMPVLIFLWCGWVSCS